MQNHRQNQLYQFQKQNFRICYQNTKRGRRQQNWRTWCIEGEILWYTGIYSNQAAYEHYTYYKLCSVCTLYKYIYHIYIFRLTYIIHLCTHPLSHDQIHPTYLRLSWLGRTASELGIYSFFTGAVLGYVISNIVTLSSLLLTCFRRTSDILIIQPCQSEM